jgi:hypothetical protein
MAIKKAGYTSRAAEALCEMVRLSLLVFLAKMKRSFFLAAGELVPFQQKFEDIIALFPGAVGVCPELGLWCMIFVACSYDQLVPQTLTGAIRDTMATMSISTALDAFKIAKNVIWVEAVFATKVDALILDLDSSLRKSLT